MIYLAAPLFNDFERQRNQVLTSALEAYASVFLPQRDGGLLVDSVREGKAVEQAELEVFQGDIDALDNSLMVVAVLDGAVVDEGVAFELGYAFGRNIICVGLQTDSRRQLPTGNNPMISRCLSQFFISEPAMIEWIKAEYNTFDKVQSATTDKYPRRDIHRT